MTKRRKKSKKPKKKERKIAESEGVESGLDNMMSYGERTNAARFQVSLRCKLSQEEIEDIASRAGHSTRALLMMAKGETNGSDAFAGTSRTVLVAEAIGFLQGTTSGAVISLVVITTDGKFSDRFHLERVPAEKLFSEKVVKALHRHQLVTDDELLVLGDGVDITSSSFQRGDLISNKVSKVTSQTATQRLSQRRRFVKERLSSGVMIAQILRVDNSDSSLKWRCIEDRSKQGWVKQNCVTKIYTTREPEDDDDDDRGLWGLFGGCGEE